MKIRTREEKGITLVALIITIIVLLILAVVAIRAVTGDGIIAHAKNAQTGHEEAQAKENNTLSYYQTYLDAQGQIGKWVQYEDSIKKVNEDGTIQELEIGDYVNYESGVSTYKDENGKEKTWRILGADNGQILLMSATGVSEVTLDAGKKGYEEGISILNTECGKYNNNSYATKARSITVDDINRITGYNPTKTGNGKIFHEGQVSQYLNKVTFTLQDGKVYYSSTIHPELIETTITSFTDIDGTKLAETEGIENTITSITLESNYYGYYPETLTNLTDEGIGMNINTKAYDMIFNREPYVLASKYISCKEGKVTYGLRILNTNYKRISGAYLWDSSKGGIGMSVFFANAVVYLKPEIELKLDKTVDGINYWSL